MNFIKTIIKRPVTMLMMSIMIAVFGVLSYLNMPVALFPTIEMPILGIYTTYVGADAETVETEVTEVIEKYMKSVADVVTVTTYSYSDVSVVALEFDYNIDVADKEQELKSVLDTITFASGVDEPSVVSIDVNDFAIAVVSMVSNYDTVETMEISEEVMLSLQSIDGVSSVSMNGGLTREFMIEMLPGSESYILNVVTSLADQNLEIPIGNIAGEDNNSIRAVSKLTSLEDLQNLQVDIVTSLGKEEQVALSTLASVYLSESYQDGYSFINGEESVTYDVMLISGGNIVDVVDGVKSVMAEYESENLSFTLIEDQSEYATESVSTVWSSLILGALLAMLIIILFLKNIRTSLIISVSMPLSVLGALSGMYLCGVEMNVVAMCGLAIGIGMLVDNSIVVIENITRHMDMGKTREEASFEGAKEVALPLIASTLTTVAVFFPIMLIEGMTQMIFKDLSIAVIFSLVFSLIVAITVIPTLFAKFGRVSKFAQNGSESLRLARANGKVIYTRTENLYKSVLVKTLKAKPIVILLAIVILASTVMLGLSAGYEFIPAVDKGVLEITLDTNGEEAVSNLQAAVDMETYLFDTYDNIQTISTAVGGSDIFGGGNETVVLQVILDNTNVATSEMVSDLRRLQIDGVDISVAEIDGIVATFVPDASGISVSILGESDEQMAEISDAVIQALGSVDGIGNITTSLEQDTVEYQITIDETNEIVQSYGVSNVIMLLRYGISSQNITTIKSDGEVLDVVVTFAESEIDTLAKIQDLYVVPPTTFKPYGVKLSEVAEITEVSKTASITKENGLQVLTISMQLFEGVMGDVSDEVTAVVAEVMEEYQDYSMESSGTMAYLFESFEGLFIALGISLFLVFAIIASQFESIKQAFAIILSVPFAFSGAFIAIAISGDTLNVVSLIGMIMLVGVVVNNAIVMIDKFNQNISAGMPPFSAVVYGATTRLRPIMMTTLTTVLALIPLAFGADGGAEMLSSMGIVVIGGLLFATIVTLFLTPILYSIICRIKVPKLNQNQEN